MAPKHNILVTGGAGLIGSVVAERLISAWEWSCKHPCGYGES